MKDFCGFRFGLTHSSDLHLIVVSSSNRYVKNTQPGIKDYTLEVPGGNGFYLFGQTYSTQEFNINVAFDSIDEACWRKISNLFSSEKPQDLVFDEYPFKTYRAKLKQKPEFKTVCFTNKTTGQRIYKGEGTLAFICYYPFAFNFNKYIVRAADYYSCNNPENIINHKIDKNKWRAQKVIVPTIKKHYNVEKNMRTPWRGGYPSIEQVQAGELYFNGPNGKTIIDTKDYFNNIPEWQAAAKLLISPTLDYDKELIYMPQFSQINYYNMDSGLNRDNYAIGSRLLVYNPGDMPINFELKLGHLVNKYRASMKDKNYKFRISRYNVQRLTLPQAIEWCELQPFNRDNISEKTDKNDYFAIIEGNGLNASECGEWREYLNNKIKNEEDYENKEWDYSPKFRMLGKAHPKHAYYVEPIPREKLGYFIRLFYWQSLHTDDPRGYLSAFNWEEGKQLAERYEEMYEACLTEEDRYELYWKTLKEAILDKYDEVNAHICHSYGSDMGEVGNPTEKEHREYQEKHSHNLAFLGHDNFLNDYKIDMLDMNRSGEDKKIIYNFDSYQYRKLFHDYIYYPPEYIREPDEGIDYGKYNFNISHIPSYYTEDYLEINSNNFEDILTCECETECDVTGAPDRSTIKPLYVDFEKRMVYNINEPKWENKEDDMNNFYDFTPKKRIFNDNIEKGSWFKIPPGWSMIEILPVIKESVMEGKRWMDAEQFTWGNTTEVFRQHYDKVYEQAILEYVSQNCPIEILTHKYINVETKFDPYKTYSKDGSEYDIISSEVNLSAQNIKTFLSRLSLDQLENYINFNKWLGYYSQYSIPDGWAGRIGADVAARYNGKNPFFYKVWEDNRDTILNVHFEIQSKRMSDIERGFLKVLNDFWRINTPDANGLPSGNIHDWWWYANSYIWANFPPVYWAYADLLNEAEIDYTPLFY